MKAPQKEETTKRPAIAEAPAAATSHTLLPASQIRPDSGNRTIEEDEDFRSLVDSVRVLGILQPLHVQQEPGGGYRLVDGERRWRAAQKAGLETIPCQVWPEHTSSRDALVAGVVLNEQRKAHSPIHVARRLREIKNDYRLSAEQLAERTGLSVDRIGTYLLLPNASDFLLTFFAENDVSLWVAAEFVRYEKSFNEARARKLAERYLDSPMSSRQIAALRKGKKVETAPKAPESRRPRFAVVEAALRRDAATASAELEHVLARFGYRLVRVEQASGGTP